MRRFVGSPVFNRTLLHAMAFKPLMPVDKRRLRREFCNGTIPWDDGRLRRRFLREAQANSGRPTESFRISRRSSAFIRVHLRSIPLAGAPRGLRRLLLLCNFDLRLSLFTQRGGASDQERQRLSWWALRKARRAQAAAKWVVRIKKQNRHACREQERIHGILNCYELVLRIGRAATGSG